MAASRDLFVCNDRRDYDAAIAVVRELERRGITCWLAPRDVGSGRSWDREMLDAMGASAALLLIFSERCNDSRHVLEEIATAEELHKRIIPIRIDNAQPRGRLATPLSRVQMIDGTGSSRGRAIEEVTERVRPRGAAAQIAEAAQIGAARLAEVEPFARVQAAPPVTASAGSAAHSSSDVIAFGVAHPGSVTPGTSFIAETWVFRHEDSEKAERLALAALDAGSRFRSEGSAEVARGARLSVTMDVAHCRVKPRRQFLWWNGDTVHVGFRVGTGTGAVGKCDGEYRVSLNGLAIGYVPFQIDLTGVPSSPVMVRGRRLRSGFASYASADRRDVLARVQGIEKSGIGVYVDVRDLPSGAEFNEELLRQIDRSDVLYLFWSRHAAASKWVEREWRYALDRKGIKFIDPVPLVDPHKVPPPPELAGEKHFNDWTLAYVPPPRLWERMWSWVAG